ncbi:MAG: undecaprenyl-diphosphate phosphatase [Alphaproteobacteria bacterium]
MSLLEIALLAVVQGITEFLPISSWAHLIIVREIAGWPDPGLAFEVAVHAGTLVAVVTYFRRDLLMAGQGVVALLRGRREPGALLALNLLLATVPVLIAGYLAADAIESGLRTVRVIAWTTLGFGLLLYAADRLGATARSVERMGVGSALAIGLAQALALVPGTSRSGITMTAARALGLGRRDAARFSMLLSVPVTVAAVALSAHKLYRQGDVMLGADAALAAGLSLVAALAAIALLMRWLERASFTPFVV